MTAIRFIHLYFEPLFQLPGSKFSPCRQRSQIGMANARYRPMTAIEVTAKNATGMISGASAVPMLTLINAGSVTMAQHTATSITAFAGTRFAVSDCHILEPGIAPSRLNAKVIRDAEVMQDVAQKTCAEAEMNSTRVAQFVPIDWVKMYAT